MILTESTIASIVWKIREGKVIEEGDKLAAEEPLSVEIIYGPSPDRKRSRTITMRTPGHDAELAAGYLFGEGWIRSADEIDVVREGKADTGAIIEVELKPEVIPPDNITGRQSFQTSSCGVCGKESLDDIEAGIWPAMKDDLRISSALLSALPGILRRKQDLFEQTGGLHASALFDSSGRLIVLREDVGRHNALDKVIGYSMLQGLLPLDRHILLLSGRISFELVQKARRAAIQLIAAVGAPSSLAVKTADKAGITLVGFLRDNRFNVYCGIQRLGVQPGVI